MSGFLEYLKSLFKTDPGKKILKERDKLYKIAVILQRNGDISGYGKIMKKIDDLENEYDRIKNERG